MDPERFIGEIGKACRRIRYLTRTAGGRDAAWAREAIEQLASCSQEIRSAAHRFRVLNSEMAGLSAALDHERREAHRLFMTAHQPYLVTDLDGAIALANHAAGEMFGLEAPRLVGKSLATLVDAVDRARFDGWLDRLRDAAEDGSLCGDCGGRHDLEMLSADADRAFPCELTAVPVSDRDAAIRSIRWIVSDLTERRAAAVARGLVEEIRRRDEFLAILGHELRNPLASITLAADLLSERGGSPARKGATWAVLKRNTDQLRRLVDDLMDVSRVSRGKIVLQMNVVDLRDVAAGAAETMQPILSARNHRLAFLRPRQKLPVRGDPARLVQVLTNLIDNAAKYTPMGGHLAMSLRRDGDRALISVTDDGIGIPAHMLERIFDVFEQVPGKDEPNRRGGGLGLGLALVRQLVELHEGTVRAFSPGEGKGSTFVLGLPLVADPAVRAPAPEEIRPVGPAAVSRLLVIDDNQDAAELLALSLRVRGYQVDVAHDGGGGIERARAGDHDVALVDLALPDIDGYEVSRQIRREWPAMRLVALTGYGDERTRSQASLAGFDGFLLKPARADLVEKTILALGVPAT